MIDLLVLLKTYLKYQSQVVTILNSRFQNIFLFSLGRHTTTLSLFITIITVITFPMYFPDSRVIWQILELLTPINHGRKFGFPAFFCGVTSRNHRNHRHLFRSIIIEVLTFWTCSFQTLYKSSLTYQINILKFFCLNY